MASSYHDPKSKYASAREWLASSERRAMVDQEKERNAALILRSRNWLEKYMARPRKTAFNWCPSIVFKEFKEPNQDGSNKEPSEGTQEGKC